MDFLEDSHHLGCEETDVVVVTRPEGDRVKLLFEVTDFDGGFGVADIHHFLEEDKPRIERLARILSDEREVNLVSQEGLVGQNGDVVLEEVHDQLIDDAQLELVATDESNVPICIAIKADYLLQEVILKRCVEMHCVVAVKPLCELLACFHRDQGPFGEEVMVLGEVDLHHLFAIGKSVCCTFEESITFNRHAHEQTPAIKLAFVLDQFNEGVGGCNRDVKPLVVLVGLGGGNPARLIGLQG